MDNWTVPQPRPCGFGGAEAVYATDDRLLAKWDHERCRGWQLYLLRRPSRTRWLVGAGAESLGWTAEEAMRWAEGQITGPP